MNSNKELINFFERNNYNSIADTGMTWQELASKWGRSGEWARATWRRWKKSNFTSNKISKEKDDLFLQFCKEKGFDPNKVSRATYISHLGPEKATFNLTLKNEKDNTLLTEEDISDSVQKIVSNLPSSFYRRKSYVVSDAKALVVNITDIHVGMDIPVNFYNKFWNKDELFKRLSVIIDQIIRHKKQYTPKKIVVNFLGDICDGLDGSTTRGKTKNFLPQNMDNKEQYETAVEFLLHLSAFLSELDVPCSINYVANSNHGGILDYTVGYTIKEILSESTIEFNLLKDFFSFVKIDNWDLLLTHGYDEALVSKFNKMPINLNTTWLLRIIEKRKKLGSLSDKCLVLRGDLHRAKNVSYQNFDDILVPALCPGSDYVQSNFDHDLAKSGFTSIILYENDYLYHPFVFNT